ncbi:MAG: transglutaminase family protein [Coprococcus sp.]
MRKIKCLCVFAILLFVSLSSIFQLEVKAADKYEVKVDDTGKLTCYYDGEQIVSSRVAIKASGKKYKVVKPGTKGSSIYYFDKNGKGKKLTSTRFMNIEYDGKTKVYYAKNGIIQKNKIVGSRKEGYYYVDKDGVRIKNNEYVITKSEKGRVVCYYKGKLQKNIRVAVKTSGNKFKSVEPGTEGSDIYYFNKYGIGKKDTGNRFVDISYKGKQKKYYIRKGIIQKNEIVGAKNEYKYVGTDGVCVTDKTTNEAVKFVMNYTSQSDSNETKLRKCYIYLASHYRYKRIYDVSRLYPEADDIPEIAYEIFSTGYGNCHRFASAFAYIARVLGYTSRVGVGWCHGSGLPGASGGYTPHGWAEVYMNGHWYCFDPDMDLYTGSHSSYYKMGSCYYKVRWKLQSDAYSGSISWKNID